MITRQRAIHTALASTVTLLARRIGIFLAAFAMFSVVGGPWAILQTVAWTCMLHDYSQQAPISVSVEKTFDGKHPCPLCLKIAKGKRAQEKTPLAQKIAKRTTVFVSGPGTALKPPAVGTFAFPPGKIALPPARNSAPPVPVPRRAFA